MPPFSLGVLPDSSFSHPSQHQIPLAWPSSHIQNPESVSHPFTMTTLGLSPASPSCFAVKAFYGLSLLLSLMIPYSLISAQLRGVLLNHRVDALTYLEAPALPPLQALCALLHNNTGILHPALITPPLPTGSLLKVFPFLFPLLEPSSSGKPQNHCGPSHHISSRDMKSHCYPHPGRCDSLLMSGSV